MHLRIIINRRILRGREKKCAMHSYLVRDGVCVCVYAKRERTSGLPPTVTALRAIIIIFGGEKKGTSANNRVVPFSFRETKGAKNDAYTIL